MKHATQAELQEAVEKITTDLPRWSEMMTKCVSTEMLGNRKFRPLAVELAAKQLWTQLDRLNELALLLESYHAGIAKKKAPLRLVR